MQDQDEYSRYIVKYNRYCKCLLCSCEHHCGISCTDCDTCPDCSCEHCENFKIGEN